MTYSTHFTLIPLGAQEHRDALNLAAAQEVRIIKKAAVALEKPDAAAAEAARVLLAPRVTERSP